MRRAGDAIVWYERRRRTLMVELGAMGLSDKYIADLFGMSVGEMLGERALHSIPVTRPWYGGELP